jgi:hypothetical protein
MLDDMNSVLCEKVTREFQFDRRTFDELVSEAGEVVVFGSRAAGLHNPDSDLDLLVVTPRKRRVFAAGLDCVLMTPEEIDNSFWLGSELASHVVEYGHWIKGAGVWRSRVQISNRAVIRKRERVSSVLRNAAKRWSRLHPIFHSKYLTTIRRELQRLKLLSSRLPIPPTPLLDSEWQVDRGSAGELLQLALSLESLKSCDREVEIVLRNSLVIS